MTAKTFALIVLTGTLGLLCLCGKDDPREVRYGPDSLTMAQLRALLPADSSQTDSVNIRVALRRYSLARTVSEKPSQADSVAEKLARKLTLQSGKEWSPEAGAVLLKAATALEKRAGSVKELSTVIAFADSVFAASGGPLSFVKDNSLRDEIAAAGPAGASRKNSASAGMLFGALLEVPGDEAAILDNFVGGMNGGAAVTISADRLDRMVKGIVSKQGAGGAPRTGNVVPGERKDHERIDSSALLALKYRSQESIRDSIARHLPDLQMIYKKQLKLNEMAGGVVWMVFHVDAEGRVTDARIKSSAIANRQFQQLLEEYVRTIHFKAVPKDMGPMIFEFPFEFKAEG